MNLDFNTDVQVTGPFELPGSLVELWLDDYPSGLDWPTIPSTLLRLKINNCDRPDLPSPLNGVNSLELNTMPNVQMIPTLADTVLVLSAWDTGLQMLDQTTSQHFGNISLNHNDSLQYVSVQTLGGAYSAIAILEDCAVLDSVNISGVVGNIELLELPALTFVSPFEEGLHHLYLHSDTSLTEIPPLPGSLIVFSLSDTRVTTVPELPGELVELVLALAPFVELPPDFPQTLESLRAVALPLISEFPGLPDGLRNLDVDQVPLVTLDVPDSVRTLYLQNVQLQSLEELPDSLYELVIGVSNLQFSFPFTHLPSLPEGLNVLTLGGLPIHCLPVLPEGLTSFSVWGCDIQCQPNHPPATDLLFPLCSIVNSECPDALSSVSGVIFWDRNENGQQDLNEPGWPNAIVHASPSGYMTGTDSVGQYEMGIPIGDNVLSISVDVPNVQDIAPEEYPVSIASAVEVLGNLDFAVHLDTVVPDLSVTGYWLSSLRQGTTREFDLFIQNNGSSAYGVQARFELDPTLEYLSSSVEPEVFGNELVWEWDSLAMWEGVQIHCYFNVAINTPMGTSISMSALVTPFVEDVDTLNNVFVNNSSVVGSFDPNDKQVLPQELTEEQGAEGFRVEYLIRFQNTGTSYAERVLITDTLSSDLEPTSFQFLESSHIALWFYRDGALHFLFDPIHLPDSTTDELASHGFVSFSIATHPGLGSGMEVANEANIYFDFNEPVITEPCILSVIVPDQIAEVGLPGGTVFPIPTADWLQIQHNGSWTNAMASVIDVRGVVVMTQRIGGNADRIDLRSLSHGLYALRLEKDGRSWSQRIVRE